MGDSHGSRFNSHGTVELKIGDQKFKGRYRMTRDAKSNKHRLALVFNGAGEETPKELPKTLSHDPSAKGLGAKLVLYFQRKE